MNNPNTACATFNAAAVPFGIAASTIDQDFFFGGDDDFIRVLRNTENAPIPAKFGKASTTQTRIKHISGLKTKLYKEDLLNHLGFTQPWWS